MSDKEHVSDEELAGTDLTEKVAGAPGVTVVPDDPAAPSKSVSSKRQRLSDLFTIVRHIYQVYMGLFDSADITSSSAQALR